MRLEDKVVPITESSTGSGQAVARRCAAEGAGVLIHGSEHDIGGTRMREDWHAGLLKVYAPARRNLWPDEIAAWLPADECGPISGQVFDLEQHPFLGRNPSNDTYIIPSKKPSCPN